MKRALLATMILSGCATVRPEASYYTPERCFGLRDSERKASTVEAVAGDVALAAASGGVIAETLDKAGVETGPAALIGLGIAVISGATWKGAKAAGTSAHEEWSEMCQSMPVPAFETVATN